MNDRERYIRACHAMQSAVAFELECGSEKVAGATPKYLRVGVNSALVEFGALVKLMVDKGLITLEEFDKALADAMEAEVARYQAIYPGVTFE